MKGRYMRPDPGVGHLSFIIALYGQALRAVSEPYPVLIIALYGQALRTVSEGV